MRNELEFGTVMPYYFEFRPVVQELNGSLQIFLKYFLPLDLVAIFV